VTGVKDAAITERWRKRLAARRRLLDDALEDLHDAATEAQRADAKARIALRRDQIADAQAVLAGRLKLARPSLS